MYIIAGLGNPGKEYEGTRHNTGFMTIDVLADRYNIDIREKAHKALIGKGVIEGQKVILVKPQTYMNLSGESIRSVMDFYKVTPENFIVIFDDISLEPGQLRIRKKGSAGGHNGIKNIIAQLGTQEFARIKVGVGAKPSRMDLADYVLGHFSKGEKVLMEQAYKDGAAAAADMMTAGIDDAMNQFNGLFKKGPEA
ncbi:MAG: aminoacyl-tRNA hydrolase [Clostridium sp.]